MKVYKLRHKPTGKFLGSGATLDAFVNEHKCVNGKGRTFTCIGHIKSMIKNNSRRSVCKPSEEKLAMFEVVMFEMLESTTQDLMTILES
jgi:hypothetical protein